MNIIQGPGLERGVEDYPRQEGWAGVLECVLRGADNA